MIELKHITQEYDTADGKGKFFACKDVNVHVKPGDIFGIIGRSGAGKSTLVRCINLLNRPTSGSVIVDGKDLTKMSESELREERRSIGMIFQHFNLLASRTVYDNIAFPLEIQGISQSEIKKRVQPLLELVQLQDRGDYYPSQLSGGQKQRVGIAQAIVHNPLFVVLDEPTNGLDPAGIKELRDILKNLAHKENIAVLVSSHLMSEMEMMCDRVGVIVGGRILDVQTTEDMISAAQDTTIRYTLKVSDPAAAVQALTQLPEQAKQAAAYMRSQNGVTVEEVTGE